MATGCSGDRLLGRDDLTFSPGSPFPGPSVNCLWSGDKAEREVGRSKPGRGGRSAEHAQRGRGQESCRPKRFRL